MSKLSEYLEENREFAHNFADKNTPKNDDGRAVIPRGDEWEDEKEWDKDYEERLRGTR